MLNFILKQAFKYFLMKAFLSSHSNTRYSDAWYMDFICEHLSCLESGFMNRLILNIPPRYGKSFCVSIAWSAWLLGLFPERKIICTSYSQRLADKHSMDTRDIMRKQWYMDTFPGTVLTSSSKAKLITSKNGFRMATSTGGTLTGEGADIIILDDPQTPMQAMNKKQRDKCIHWYDNTLSTRLNNKKEGAIILVMQRLHSHDLSGHLLKQSGWRYLSLPALAMKDETLSLHDFSYYRRAGEALDPTRETVEQINQMKEVLGSRDFASQYQQCPASDSASAYIRADWLVRYDEIELRNKVVYQSWDLAFQTNNNNDYSVCTTWMEADNHFYLIDVYRRREEFSELLRSIASLHKKYNPGAVLIESVSGGQLVIEQIRKNTMLPVISITPKYSKETRLLSCIPLFEAGRILLPRKALWLYDYESELLDFPNMAHDDQVDSTTQFLNWYQSRGPNIRITAI